ncbi:asparaginase (plasmid) [Exiguobacterium sp. Helios]|nr:asparaginase [Exiguobacterium sp. Helios]
MVQIYGQKKTCEVKNMLVENKITPTKSWMKPESHYIEAMDSDWYKTLLRVQNQITHSTFNFFREQDILSVSLPITTGSVTSPMGLGSDSLPVKINLEGLDTYLADSMQFHLEYALRNVPNGVHYLMPTFRGELADARHLCQFYHSEAEIQGDLNDVMRLVSEYVHYLCKDLLKYSASDIKAIAGSIQHIEDVIELNASYPKVSLEEAVELLNRDPRYVETHPAGFDSITNQGEQELIKLFGGIVWLTHPEYKSVPFYQAIDSDGKHALSGDLLFGIGEVVGSGQRHTTIEDLTESMEALDVDAAEYEWYLNMKKLKPMDTAGFGMGIERFILWLFKHDDIRDCQMIPRFNGVEINP